MAQEQVKTPTADEIKQIAEAMPKAPRAKPAKPRKLLVLGYGPSHEPTPYAAIAFEMMGKSTGAFEATVTSDGSYLAPEKLAQFDAIVINNWHGWNPFLPIPTDQFKKLSAAEQAPHKEIQAARRKAFMDFITKGGGIVGVHAASLGQDDWPEYATLIGAKYHNVLYFEATFKVEEPTHPVAAAFNGQGFHIVDEIYEFQAPYSRQNLRVLLSVDTQKTTQKKGTQFGTPVRTDDDYAVTWVKSQGKGRVFYTALGHNPSSYWNPLFLQHVLDGVQFAVGDIPADTAPVAAAIRPTTKPSRPE